jgi:RimJ/RimL family protein N-acetyltransferase
MKLKALSLADLEQVRLWRNGCLESLRTPFLLTQEMQEAFYRDVVCNRQSNARYWGAWTEEPYPKTVLTGNITMQRIGVNSVLVGMCGLENIQWENRLAEISLILDPEYPMYADALRLLLSEAFMSLNLENVYTEVYDCSPYRSFWREIIDKYKCDAAILPCRKYWNGRYFNSMYLNVSKGAYLRHENTLPEPAQALG